MARHLNDEYFSGNKLKEVGAPVDGTDAANKDYVDGALSDISALPASTKYGASLSLIINNSTFVVTAQLKDQDGNNLGAAQTIDLPLESVVVNGSYDNNTKKVILTLQNGNTVEFSVADLVAGLQSEITAQNPLSADLVTDGTTNKVFTATEKSKLAGIEAGAEVNVQSDWSQSDTSADDFIKNKPLEIVNAQNKQILSYDSNTNKWKNVNDWFIDEPSLPTLPDGTIIENITQDYDGNWYDGVILGTQIWLKQNLRTTHYADGTAIEAGGTNTSSTVSYYYNYTEHSLPLEKRGLLYNQAAVLNGAPSSTANPSGVQGIAPNGWHIPSPAEYNKLISHIGSVPEYILNNNSSYIAKALAAKEGWETSTTAYAVGNNLSANNATNFTIYGAGGFNPSTNLCESKNRSTIFWTSRSTYRTFMTLHSKEFIVSTLNEKYGSSVRCVCDLSASAWVSTNITKYYLKHTSNGAVWSRLADVAETGSYNDLSNKPTIPTVPTNVSSFNNDAGYITANDVPVEVFVCNYNSSNNTMDKTVAEIYAAFTAGKVVICKNGAGVYTLDGSSSDTCRFHSVQNQGSSLSFKWIKYISGAWSTGQDDWNSKQDTLVGSGNGQNIKTVNSNSILGSGDVDINTIIWCTYTETDSTNHTGTMSMTVAELEAAVVAGNIVCTIIGNLVYYLTFKGTGSNLFVCIQDTSLFSQPSKSPHVIDLQ